MRPWSRPTARGWDVAASAPRQSGDVECQVQRLAGVQARVAHRLVALLEVLVEDLFAAAEALGHVLVGELDVDAAGDDVGGLARREEPVELAEHVVEASGLVAAAVLEGIAV